MPTALILTVAAFILAVLAALVVGEPRFKLGWAALACWILASLFGK